MYYNTTNETGTALENKIAKCKSQREATVLIFKSYNLERGLSPSEVWQRANNQNSPITSWRRAISDLTLDGILEKTNIKITGMYGEHEHLWRLAQ